MNIKFLNLNTKKIISVLCAIMVVMASLPLSALLLKVNAADGAIIDFQGEDAGDIVAGNDNFSIGGQDNEDSEYFYASNGTEETVTLTVDGLQLEAGKKYTVSMDLYSFGISKDASGNAFGIKVYGGAEASVEAFVANEKLSIEEWTSYQVEFTAKEGSNKLDFSALNSASALIEDFAIIDESGKAVKVDLAAACDAYNGDGTFAYGTLAALTGGSMKPTGPAFNGDPNYVIYFDTSIDNNFWVTKMGMDEPNLPAGNTYTVEFDVYALSMGKNVVFGATTATWSLDTAINGTGGTHQVWQEEPSELNKWTHYSFEVPTVATWKGVMFYVIKDSVDFKGYIDNLTIKDGTGTVVASFNPTEADLDKTSNCAKVVELPKEITAKSYPAIKMEFDNGENFRTDGFAEGVSISFDYYLVKGEVELQPNIDGTPIKLTEGVNSATLTPGPQASSFKFLATNGKAVLYVWNIKLMLNGSPIEFKSRADRTDCKFEEIVFADIPGAHYGEVDNSGDGGNSGSGSSGSVDLTAPAYKMTYDSGEAFRTSYDNSKANNATIKFDYYLKKGRVKVYGSNDGNEAGYLEAGVNSFELSATKSGSFWIAQRDDADELYIWNVELTQDGAPLEFKSYEGRTTCEFEKITVGDVPDIGNTGNNGSSGSNNANIPAIKMEFDNGENFRTDGYDEGVSISFDYYLEKGEVELQPNQDGTSIKLTSGVNSATLTPGPKASSFKFLATNGKAVLYVWNIKLMLNGSPIEFKSRADRTDCKFEEITYGDIPGMGNSGGLTPQPVVSNYAIYIDNSANEIQSGQIWFNLLGAPQMELTPGKTYTLKFDNYALVESYKGHCYVGVHNTGGGITGQNWWNTSDTLNGWATQSVNFTPTGDKALAYHTLYVGAGFKGYLDNFRVYDGDTEVALLTFDETNEGKESGGATVVKLPAKIDPDYVPSGNLSGLEIAILKGKAGKDGASITLGGAKSPLTLESNKTYKLIFKYYQAKPTASGELNLFSVKFIESALGKANDVTWFKKNSTDGWTEVKVIFSTGNITSAAADWFQLTLNPNAWVFFDDFEVEETEVDTNKEVSKITFDQKDDSIYPKVEVENAVFEWSSEMGGTFKAVNATEYTNDAKNSNRQISFKNIKMKSNTNYKISIDFYLDRPYSDYIAAFGYSKRNLGVGSDNHWEFINNETVIGWQTITFTVTTGEVVPNATYFNLVCYDVNDSSEPRTIWFDNFTITEQYTIETSVNDDTLGTATKTFGAQGGDDVRVVANAFEGATFEGWYEYGDLVSTDAYYRLNDLDDNHKLEAKFSGKAKPGTVIVQGFEDYELGDIGFDCYEIVSDSKNVLEGNKSLHVKPVRLWKVLKPVFSSP